MSATSQEPIAAICLTTSIKPAIPSNTMTTPGGISRLPEDRHGSFHCTFLVGEQPVSVDYGANDLLLIYPGDRILRLKQDLGETLVYSQVFPVANSPPDESHNWLTLMNRPREMAKKKKVDEPERPEDVPAQFEYLRDVEGTLTPCG